jgi:hypothetical protein
MIRAYLGTDVLVVRLLLRVGFVPLYHSHWVHYHTILHCFSHALCCLLFVGNIVSESTNVEHTSWRLYLLSYNQPCSLLPGVVVTSNSLEWICSWLLVVGLHPLWTELVGLGEVFKLILFHWVLSILVLWCDCDPSLVLRNDLTHCLWSSRGIFVLDVPVIRVIHHSQVVWIVNFIPVVLGSRLLPHGIVFNRRCTSLSADVLSDVGVDFWVPVVSSLILTDLKLLLKDDLSASCKSSRFSFVSEGYFWDFLSDIQRITFRLKSILCVKTESLLDLPSLTHGHLKSVLSLGDVLVSFVLLNKVCLSGLDRACLKRNRSGCFSNGPTHVQKTVHGKVSCFGWFVLHSGVLATSIHVFVRLVRYSVKLGVNLRLDLNVISVSQISIHQSRCNSWLSNRHPLLTFKATWVFTKRVESVKRGKISFPVGYSFGSYRHFKQQIKNYISA